MEGSYYIKKRKDGRWECRVEIGRDNNGKSLYRYFYGSTKSGVEAKAHTVQKNMSVGAEGDPPNFATWALQWYQNYEGEVSPTTYEGYQYTLNILMDYFGTKRLDEIRAMNVEEFLKAMARAGRSRSYTSKLRGMLYQIMMSAEDNDLITKNPVRLAKKIKNKNTPKEKDAFSAEEIKLLMERLPINKIGITIRVMLGTGLRSQEVLALTPDHIEPDGSMIYVRQAVKLVKGCVSIGSTKSESGIRDVPVPREIQKYAAKLRNAGNENFVWAGKKSDVPVNPSYFRRIFAAALKSVPGVRVLTPHSCRHTYVTMLMESGVDIKTIQELAGHNDMKMSLHYTHISKNTKEKAVNGLEKFLEYG